MSIQWANTAFNRTILGQSELEQARTIITGNEMKIRGSSNSCNTVPDLSHQTITSFMKPSPSAANNWWGYYGDIPVISLFHGLSAVICESSRFQCRSQHKHPPLWGNWPLPNRTPSKMSAEFLSPHRSDPMRFGRDAHQCHQLSSSEDAIAVSFTLSLVLFMSLQLGLSGVFS